MTDEEFELYMERMTLTVKFGVWGILSITAFLLFVLIIPTNYWKALFFAQFFVWAGSKSINSLIDEWSTYEDEED